MSETGQAGCVCKVVLLGVVGQAIGDEHALALRPDEEERRGEAAGMVQAEPRIVLGVGQQIGERLELRLRLGREPQGPKGGWLAEVEVARARAMALR